MCCKMEEKNTIINEFYRCFDENAGEKVAHLVSSEFIDYDARNPKQGLEELQGLIGALHGGFSDILHELEEVSSLQNGKIFVRWKMTAKHSGVFLGMEATGKDIVLRGHDVFSILNGKIVELWHIEQLLSLVEQISPQK